jgi:hypothetical protein
MSKNRASKRNPNAMGEGKTLPATAPDARSPKSNRAKQSHQNVLRAKRWVDDHET